MPQEIDGKGSEILPLCRNRVARGSGAVSAVPLPRPLSRNAGPRGSPKAGAAMHRPQQAENMKEQKMTAPRAGASRVVLALALAGSCAFAQAVKAEDEEELRLAPVTVSAHDALAVPYDGTGVSVTVLDTDELKKEGIVTLSDALTTVPGVFVLPGGGANQRGNVSNIGIRGMQSAAYTLPMIDGIRANATSSNGMVAPNILARANMFDLGNVELLRGAQGATYGNGTMGGVLYMETPEGQGEPSLSLFNEGGSHNTYTGNITAQGQKDKLSYFLSSTYEHTGNDLHYVDGSKPAAKHAGRYTNYAQAVRLDYRPDDETKATLTYRREDAEFAYAGRYDGWESAYPYSFRSNLISAKLHKEVTHAFTTGLTAGYYGTDNMLGHGYNQNIRNVQLEWRNAYRWNERHTTTAGLAWNRSQYTVDSGAGKRNSDRDLDNMYAVFAEHSYAPVQAWVNSLALRLDSSSVFDEQFTLRAATSYKFNQERTRVFASAGCGYTAPDAFRRSNGTATIWGWQYKGNPDLDCEHAFSADLGAEHEYTAGHRVSATLFLQRTEDAILNSYTPTYTTWVNGEGHTTAQGIELAAEGTWEEAWNTGYRLSYTYTQPKDNDDRQLPYTARQVWSADVHTTPLAGFTTGLGLSAASGRVDSDYYGRKPLDNYYSLRWYARYEVNEHLSLHLRVENLTNQKYVTEGSHLLGDGIINAGTTVCGGCTLSF